MLVYAVLFVAGLGVGTVGTLIGAGGGWMIVPLLLFGYRFSPQEAVGTSLAVVFLNALSGSLAYITQGRVLYKMGLAFAAATIPGALMGALLVQHLGSKWFTMLFGCFLVLIAAFLHRGRQLPFVPYVEEHTSPEHLQSFRTPHMRLGILISFFVGTISSLFGIGGGIIHVPFLIVMLRIPVHAATATSHFVLAITSLTGTLVFLQHGQVRVGMAASMGSGVLLGAQLGAFLSMRMPSEPIRRTLALALAVFACWLILRTAF